MPNRKLNESAFFSRLLFFNLALILLLGVLPQIGIFQYMMQAYNTELYRFNTQSVKQIRNTVDEQLLMPTVQIAKRNLTELSDDNTALFYPMTHQIRHDYSAIVNVQEALSALQSEQPFIRYVDMYYFRDPVFFYGTRFFYFPQESGRDPGFRKPWLDKFLTTDAQVGWYAASAPDAGGGEERLISYVRSYPYFAPLDRRKAVFAIHLKESAVRQSLADSFDPASGLAFIVDERGELVTGNADPDSGAAYMQAAALWAQRTGGGDPQQGSFEAELDGREAVVAYAHSRVNNWDYVTLVDKSLFYKKAADLKNLMYALWAGLLLVGLALLYVLTKKQYGPIGSTLQRYSLQLHDLNEQLAVNKPVIKYHYIMELLSGGHRIPPEPGEEAAGASDTGNAQEMRRFLGLELLGDRICCFILQPRSAGPGAPQLAEAYQLAERLEAQSAEDARIWVIVAPDRSLYGIVDLRLSSAQAGSLIAKRIVPAAGEAYTLCIGSTRQQGSDAAAYSHREAIEAGRYGFFYPDRLRLDYGELNEEERRSTGGSVRFFADLENGLKAGERNRARQAVEGAVEEMRSGGFTADYGRQQLGELVYTFHKTLKGMGVDPQLLFDTDIRAEAGGISDAELFLEWMRERLDTAFGHLEERKQRTNRDLVEGVRQFVADHLYNEISLDRAAEHLGVTPNYVSRQFKLNTGSTFIEYVTARRMEAAAGLLQGGQMTVSAIAEKLGYQSTNHFIRIFKEKYGITPKQYQKNGPNSPDQEIS
ncbi:AraC family transcriptional regulator [Saccharibacillus deserti]|uniref:AraC family transcriptional regulator n=1 Tax=Saccharibacillus deserti TaxID=1634444 RepID=UPI0015572619|nr:AraC family transcriptional regulator [Saccharibacillus deserti]